MADKKPQSRHKRVADMKKRDNPKVEKAPFFELIKRSATRLKTSQ